MRRESFVGPGARAVRTPLVHGETGWSPHSPVDEPLTVTAVNALARQIIEGSIPPLRVQGEVTGWKRYASGHCYFCLRDADAQLRAVMFRSDAQRLPTDPDEGTQVRVMGTLTLYEKRGDYQLVVRELEAVGAGGLWRIAFEKLRAKLDAEGLLDPARKRSIPAFPSVVGVVTSPVGAVFQDIRNVIGRRAPWTRIVLAPARVQGDGAAADIAGAVERLGAAGVADVIIVGRGGGALEDLWAFNEEVVARAIAACPVPVISAVGHETDFTISDLVADLRAPTPSAAAESAVPDRAALEQNFAATSRRMSGALQRSTLRLHNRVDTLREWLLAGVRSVRRERLSELRHAAARIEALSPLAALARGYAVPLGSNGRVLRRRADFDAAGSFELRTADAVVECDVRRTRDAESRSPE